MANSLETVLNRVKLSSRCVSAANYHRLTFEAMSTQCRVNWIAQDAKLALVLQNEVLEWVAWFEAQYSRFIPDSLIGRINAAASQHWVEIDAETEAVFRLCDEMVFLTRGTFDPTALPLMKLWNWKAKSPTLPADSMIKQTMELVGWRKVQRRKGGIFLPREGMALDLGGIGKEYAVDRVVTMALNRGIPNVLVDFGQDVRVHGEPPERGSWHIGLDDPQHPGSCWTSLVVNNQAVATSGDYLRHFAVEGRRYGHIIDPRNGYPVNNGCLSVSVIAPHCTVAGIMSTSAFILGPKDGLDLISTCPGVEGAISTESSRMLSRKFYRYATG